MVKSPKIIASLLLLNLAVFAGILFYVFRAQITSPLSATTPAAKPAASGQRRAPSNAVETIVLVTNQLQWAQLESEDYKTYVARLRAIGCPEQTVRDIIVGDLDKLLAPEIAAVHGRRKELNYWHSEEEEMLNDVDPHDAFRKRREIEKRKREIIRELIDADLFRERMKASGEEDYYERRLGFLPEGRRTQVRELLEKFDDAEQKLRDLETAGERGLSAAERSQLRTMREQRESEMAGLLTPAEKRQYELWLSPTANDVRHSLYGMNASEDEFQAVYQARKAYEDVWGQRDPDKLDSASRQQMEESRAAMEGRILQGLGEQRYAEYQRGQDDDFHLLSALITRFKLPKEKAGEVYGYKTVALGYRSQIRNEPGLTPQQREEALKAIAEETKKSVQGALGPKVFNYYMRSGQGQWMSE